MSHPNIVTLFDRGEVDDQLWITMEYVDGTDAGALVSDGPLECDLALDLVGGAGAALDYAWRKQGITHRDVKPTNILVGVDEGRVESVKLADFGIAKAVGEATSLTSTGMTVGTMQYVSPEAIEGRDLDNRADVYSLGCTAFHLLTGRPPFDGGSLTALLSAHLTQAPPSVGSVAPHLPAGLDAVFAMALAKDPVNRFGSCGEFVSALRGVVAGPPFAHTVAAVPVVAEPKRFTRVLAITAAVLAVLLVAGIGAGVYLLRDDDKAAPVAVSTSTATVVPTVTITSTPTETTVTPVETYTPEETVDLTTAAPEPYEGMPCNYSEFGQENASGTLYCSAMDGAWRDKTHQSRPAVEQGSACSEPGARARVAGTDGLATCSADSSGGYSWQF
ncbi:hypothetical protein nbrc107696_23500 [Gordonia spumicola]|uniref:non-specific serine/threonine protein kinase n=1 Tax=Gordonia spumicola TaxID=589161 RepID=A0A7I9V9I4_9ACTN|nr:serine/threonine-protein kinase [Gordonia spumicola]GEE01904.1 hypothetical protein nbrc107696_23500 [Gordonia spumicola]